MTGIEEAFWFVVVLSCLMAFLHLLGRNIKSPGMTKEELKNYRQRKKEELRKAIIWNEEYDRKQCKLAQQKTVHVKSFYRRKPKRK